MNNTFSPFLKLLSATTRVQFVSAALVASTLLFITQYCSFCLHSCGLQKVQINFIVLWDSSGIFTPSHAGHWSGDAAHS